MAVKHKSSFSLYDDDDEDEPKKEEELPLQKKARPDDTAKVSPPEVVEKVRNGDGTVEPSAEPVQPPSVQRSVFSVIGSRKGERPEMEDAHIALPSVLTLPPRDDLVRASLYAILDGHGGARAAHFCETALPSTLTSLAANYKTLEAMEKGMKKWMTETYKSCDDAFLRLARKTKPAWKDGTTATTILLLNDVIYAANIGDSKAIVARRGEEKDAIVELTVDHNPQNFAERQRINKAGGQVKNGRVDGIIEVSRSIGDGQFKTRGVICTPDIKKFTLTADDRFVLIACDGLWKSFTNEDAVQFINGSLREVQELEEAREGGVKRVWEMVADRMAAEAVRRRCGDNVSLLILVLS